MWTQFYRMRFYCSRCTLWNQSQHFRVRRFFPKIDFTPIASKCLHIWKLLRNLSGWTWYKRFGDIDDFTIIIHTIMNLPGQLVDDDQRRRCSTFGSAEDISSTYFRTCGKLLTIFNDFTIEWLNLSFFWVAECVVKATLRTSKLWDIVNMLVTHSSDV